MTRFSYLMTFIVCAHVLAALLKAAEVEPNNSATQANTLIIGIEDNGAHDAGDSTDWWKFTTIVDGKITIRVSDPTDSECVGIQLFEQNGTTLLRNNGACGYSTWTSRITYNNLAPATYYIMATRGKLPGGAYTISAEFTPESLDVDKEPNNVRDSACALTLNGSVTGHLGFLNGALTDTIAWNNGKRDNIDWWKVTTNADGRLRVAVTSTASLCVQLRIRTSADTVESSDNNGWCGYSNYRSYVEVNNLAPGTYYVEAWDPNWKDNTKYGAYTLTCSLYTLTTPNDSEPNDYAAQAQLLALNDSSYGHLGYYFGDVADTIGWNNGKRDNIDWWKMIFPQRGKISVTVSSDPTLCVQMRLRIASDTVTDLKGNGSCGYSTYTPTLEYFVTASAYYLIAYDPSWKSNNKYGAYCIKTVYTIAPVASFDAVGEGTTYSFINTTTGATSFLWNFGDNTSSTQENPRHTYANPGVFTVTLIARNDAGADTITRSLTLRGLHKVEANRAGNTGDATVFVYGGGFTSASSVYLVKNGQPDIAATEVTLPRPGMLRAQFNLRGAPTGVYSVKVTTPSDSTMTLSNSFTIEAGRVAKPGVAVVGRDRILFNRWQTYTITYWNSSNIDAHGVPLWIVMSDLPDSQVQFIDFNVVLPKTAVENGLSYIKDSLPIFYRTDTLFGVPMNARVYPLYIPVIPAGQTENIQIRVKSASDIQLYAWINEPYYQSPIKGSVADCIWWAQAKAFRDGLIDMLPIPGLGCVTSIATKVYDPFDYPMPEQTAQGWMSYLGSKLWSLGTITLNCATDIIPAGKVAEATIAIISTATKAGSIVTNSIDNYDAQKKCEEAYGAKSISQRNIKAVASFDPNEKIGPPGFGMENYITKGGTYGYSIFFENKASATAPAQEILVIDTLDKNKLDLTTFAFGSVGFGSWRFTPPLASKKFAADIDLRPVKPLIVRIIGELDTATGVARWLFTSLDPATMSLTEDPLGGFLPPNISAPAGEGVVSYTVQPLPSLTNGDRIAGRAKIVFDLNDPILTNVYSNTIDTVAPTSSITGMTPVNDSTFTISWSGTDNGAGIREYSIYVSIADSPFVPLLVNTPLTRATLVCKRAVKLYSVATDSAGNVEAAPEMPDISGVLLNVSHRQLDFALLESRIDPKSRQPVIRYSVPQAVNFSIELFSAQGRLVSKLHQRLSVPGIYYAILPIKGGIGAGTYLVRMSCSDIKGKIVFNQKCRILLMQ